MVLKTYYKEGLNRLFGRYLSNLIEFTMKQNRET